MQPIIRMTLIALVSMATAAQATHMEEDTIDARTSPVGHVNIEGMPQQPEVIKEVVQVEEETVEEKAEEMVAEVTTDETSSVGRTGEAVYNTFCVSCHSIGLANAPKFGDSAAWEKLLVIGMDELVSSARKGKNVMPPSGTCADCSDDEIKNAIVYMIGQ